MKIRYEWETRDIQAGLKVKDELNHHSTIIAANLNDTRGVVYNLLNSFNWMLSPKWKTASETAEELNKYNYIPVEK